MADPIPPTKIEDFIQNLPVEVPEDGIKLFGLNPGNDLRSFQVHFITSGISIDPNKFGHQLILGIKGETGSTGGTGATGGQGVQGFPGVSAGTPFQFETSTLDTNPAAGKMRANGTFNVATTLYVSKTAFGGSDVATWLLSLASSTNVVKGQLYLTRNADLALSVWDVTSVTDAVGYVKVSVQNQSGVTSFTADDALSLHYGRAGNLGAQGEPGFDGDDGAPGMAGADGGIRLDWDTAVSDAMPADGYLRANNANLSVADFLYISNLTPSGSSLVGFLNAMAASTNTIKGTIYLTRKSDRAQAVFNILSSVSAAGYFKIGITNHSGVTSFVLEDDIVLLFARAGDAGAGAVTSVNSQVGIVLLTAGHIGSTPAGNLSATSVQAALNELDDEKLGQGIIDTDVNLTNNSDSLIASQAATKAYANTKVPNTALDTDGALAADSDTKVATQKATKTYADTKVPASALDTDVSLTANSDTKVATQKATKAYVDQIVSSQDAMVFKGVIDASVNPNYPSANAGWTYRISVAGKVGGASGINVEIGDIVLCLFDGTAAGDQATVGSNWSVIQVNIDGALTTANIGVTLQGYSSVLAAVAGLTMTNDNILQIKSGAITSRTPAQVKSDLGLSNVDNTSDLSKPISTATQTALDAKASVGKAIAMAIIFGG